MTSFIDISEDLVVNKDHLSVVYYGRILIGEHMIDLRKGLDYNKLVKELVGPRFVEFPADTKVLNPIIVNKAAIFKVTYNDQFTTSLSIRGKIFPDDIVYTGCNYQRTMEILTHKKSEQPKEICSSYSTNKIKVLLKAGYMHDLFGMSSISAELEEFLNLDHVVSGFKVEFKSMGMCTLVYTGKQGQYHTWTLTRSLSWKQNEEYFHNIYINNVHYPFKVKHHNTKDKPLEVQVDDIIIVKYYPKN